MVRGYTTALMAEVKNPASHLHDVADKTPHAFVMFRSVERSKPIPPVGGESAWTSLGHSPNVYCTRRRRNGIVEG